MLKRVPQFIDPHRLADTGERIAGQTDLVPMSRLAPMLYSTDTVAEVDLGFGVDEQGIRCVRGRVSASLSMICQRCLEPMQIPIAAQVSLGIVSSEAEASRLPEGYEPLIAAADPMPLASLIEDELILALPAIARHPASDCKAKPAAHNEVAEDAQDNAGGATGPFAVLARLRTSRQ